MSDIKKAAKSVSLLWIGSLLGSGSTFVIYMILARELGAEEFGLFGSAFSMITIITILSGFGVSQFWLKVFGKEGWEGGRWIVPSIGFILLTMTFFLVMLVIWVYIGPHEEIMSQILLIMIFYIFGQVSVEIVSSKFQLEESYTSLAIWQLAPNLSRLILLSIMVYIISYQIDIINVAWIYAIIGLGFLGISIYQISKLLVGSFDLKGHCKSDASQMVSPNIRNVYSEVWPFGIASASAFIYLQSDIIMVSYIVGDIEAGYYNAAFVIITGIMVLPVVLYQKFLLPKFHRWAYHDKEKFYRAYKTGNIVMLLLGGGVMICLLSLSGLVVLYVFGVEYQKSIPVLNILAAIIPVNFLAYSVGSTLVTRGNMKIKAYLMSLVAFINVSLNVVLIPVFAASGAAIATVLSSVILLILYYMAAQKIVFNTGKIC